MTPRSTAWRIAAMCVLALAGPGAVFARLPQPGAPTTAPATAPARSANTPVENPVIRNLAISVRYGDPPTRRRALAELAKLGEAAAGARSAVELAAKDPDRRVRDAAKAVLWAIRPAPPASRPTSRPGRKIVVGVAQIGSESLWRQAHTQSIRTEAEKRGATLLLADAMQRQANQIRALRSFVAKEVDVIAFSPIVATGYEPVLREIRQAGIPVILLDRAVEVSDASLYRTVVRSDYDAQGRAAGQWLAKKTGGKARILELGGTPGSDPAAERAKGFRSILAKNPGMKIVASQAGDFSRSKGKEVMSALLQAHAGGGISAVFAHNDDMALGALEALRGAKVAPGKGILVVSVDGVRKAVEAVVLGDLACTVECTPLAGPLLFDTIDAVLAGKPVPRQIILKDLVIDATNAQQSLKGRDY